MLGCAGALDAALPAAGAVPAEAVEAAIGAARVEITPEVPLRLALSHPAHAPYEGIRTRLFARALAARDTDGVLTVIVALDAPAVTANLRQRVAGAIRWRLGIYRPRLAIVSNGSEGLPALPGAVPEPADLSPEERTALEKYSGYLERKVVEAIDDAIEDLAPGGLVPLAGGASGGGALLAFRRDGSLRGVILHDPHIRPVAGVRRNLLESGPPGRAAKSLEAYFDGIAALVLPACGALQAGGSEAGSTPIGADRIAETWIRRIEEAGRSGALLEPRFDARLRYAELEGSEGGGLRVPIQYLGLHRGPGILFLPGRLPEEVSARVRAESGPRSLWIVQGANDPEPRAGDAKLTAELARAAARLLSESEDLARRLKPPPPLDPQAAARTFLVPGDLELELAAAEPEVTDPVAFDFDARGRLYVAEMRDYPLGPGPGLPPESRIRRLEDRDGDGYYEHAVVFAAAVPFANGVACWKGGVFVTAAPDILYLRDEDGDGVADVRRTVFTGFNVGNSQHLLNCPLWSLENVFYVNGGDSARLRSPERPQWKGLSFSRASFRFDPRSLDLEITSGYRGGFGQAFDDAGERFVCDNQNHALHVVLRREDLARAPALRPPPPVRDMSDHGRDVYPASAPLERFNDPFDAGRFTSACGVAVYRGDLLPARYRGSLFSCEPVSNLVHRDVLVVEGASFRARRGETRGEFLASTDHWFRPVNITTGPDGALYIADMYREVIEHPEWIPRHIQKLFDLRSGMDRGRIWRIVPRGRKPPAPVDLSRLEGRALARELNHPNGRRRDIAHRLLIERDGGGAPAEIETLASRDDGSPGRLHALWVLFGLGRLRPQHLRQALRSGDPRVRRTALRLARKLPGAAADAELRSLIATAAEDPHPHVRFEAAWSLALLPAEERRAPLLRLALSDASDPWFRTAILASTGGLEAELFKALLEGGGAGARADSLRELGALIGRRRNAAEAAAALEALTRKAEDPASLRVRVQALSALLEGLGPAGLEAALDSQAGGSAVAARIEALARTLLESALSEGVPLEERVQAVELFGAIASAHAPCRPLASGLLPLLGAQHPPPLQEAAARVAARHGDPGARRAALELYTALSPRVRRALTDGLLASRDGASLLFEAIRTGAVNPRTLRPEEKSRFLEALAPPLRAQAERRVASEEKTPRDEVVERYRLALRAALAGGRRADPRRGRELFRKHCAICHRFGDEGTAVGPDLTGVRTRSADALLVDLLDPNRAVAPEFVSYTAVTADGRVAAGVLVADTPAGVELRRAEGRSDFILRKDLIEFRSEGKSLMPEGLEHELKPEDVLDLLGFLTGGDLRLGQLVPK